MLAEFYGWEHEAMMRLTPNLIRAYHRQIGRVAASRELRQIRVASAPHMSKDGRSELDRELRREIAAEPEKKIVISDNASLRNFLRGRR